MPSVSDSTTSPQARMIVLLASDDTRADKPMLEALAASGVLHPSVVIAATGDVADQQGRARCASAETAWEPSEDLTSALNTRQFEEITVVSLRSGGLTASPYSRENRALAAVAALLPREAAEQMRKITVQSGGPDTLRSHEALSAEWDCHLVCDTRAHPSIDTPLRTLTAGAAEAAAQLLLAGLCAAGGWRDPHPGLTVSDYHDGGVMPARFVHAALRVVFAPNVEQTQDRRFVPHCAPWPVPEGAGCEAAAPGTVPGWDLVNQTAEMLQLRCRQPPEPAAQPKTKFRVWRKLPVPIAQTSEERAVQIFMSRLGIEDTDILMGTVQSSEAAYTYCLDAMRTSGTEMVADELARSGFQLGDGAAEADRPTPGVWNSLYQLCLSLVDGGTLPEGAHRPTSAQEGRLVWVDVSAIVPEPAPAGDNETANAADNDADISGDGPPDEPAPEANPPDPPDAAADDTDPSAAASGAWRPDPDVPAKRLRWRTSDGEWSDWIREAGVTSQRPRQSARGRRQPEPEPQQPDAAPQKSGPDEMLAGRLRMGGTHDFAAAAALRDPQQRPRRGL